MRFEYIHSLRGGAILLVVLAHAVSALSNVGGLEYLRYLLIVVFFYYDRWLFPKNKQFLLGVSKG